MTQHVWMVRAGNNNELAKTAEQKNAVAIGWSEMGDMTSLRSREDFKQRYVQSYPDHSAQRVGVNTGQVYYFFRGMEVGDYVLTYDKALRQILIGRVDGPVEYRSDLFGSSYPNIRQVQWLKHVSRDDFSGPLRNSLGRPPTVFNLDDHLSEIHRKATGETEPIQEPDIPEVPFHEEVESRADELIADLISSLDPYDFQDLVAGVLKAMGLRAISSPPGRDRGVDIIAHPDALGFGKPRIKVQVKHRTSPIGGPEMRNFLATLDRDENGLFVSTGGFSNDARVEADKSRSTVTLLDRDGFIELTLEHYEKLDPEFQAGVPLRKIWVPTK